MPTATDEAREKKREETATRVEHALNAATEWVINIFRWVMAVIIMIVGLVLAWLYIGALFSSPVVTLLATIAVILVLLLINAASV
ncbi:MAG: hypothetical protein CVT82_04190 [Alphaproteobacteria bacterium HGW-Alphaproteobacteria-4]|nr:MAG: hypothetical protein CVT82_04190 [Alphaproteobacteria bacterium HGW-Alphaproteobacteria-4]